MNTKFAGYTLVALLAGSILPTVTISDRAVALDQEQAPRPTTSAQMQPGMSRSNEVDKSFIEMMVPHHQSANEMAEIALKRAKNPQVKRLAQSIIDDQTKEIKQMQTWYQQWYGVEVPTMKMNRGSSMSGQMAQLMMMSMQQQNQMSQEMISMVQKASNVDQEFLRQMTRHHQMATMMAGMVVDTATHPETRSLAQDIVKGQTAEIAQMQQLLLQARRQ
ncbi:MAG: DUF305 domain-containing protein [Leptolyngbyaceae cyanobacterium bins.302]|nr:DUF305 domain-containing protein [Leptolyngbyaceae cyanobacterium bins.302]